MSSRQIFGAPRFGKRAFFFGLLWLASLIPFRTLLAGDVITNGNFNTDNTGWTHNGAGSVTSDSTDYTAQSPGHKSANSMQITTPTGSKKAQRTWYDYQTFNATDISTATLSLWWRKIITVNTTGSNADIFVTIIQPDANPVEVWSHTVDPGSADSPTYGNLTTLDLTSTFNVQDGTYEIRLRADVTNGNDVNSVVKINWDDVVLNLGGPPNPPTLVTPPDNSLGVDIMPTISGTGTDNQSDDLQYKIEISTLGQQDFSTIYATYDQTGGNQTGWGGTKNGAGTHYPSGNAYVSTHTIATPLDFNTTYYWRVTADDDQFLKQSASTFTFHTRGIRFYASSSTAANDETSWNTETVVGEDTDGRGHMQMVSLGAGQLMAIYNDLENTTYNLRYKIFNGTTWGSEQTVVTDAKDATTAAAAAEHHYFSAVTDNGNNVHLIYVNQTNDDVYYSSYTSGGSSWSTAGALQTGTLTHPSLSYDALNDVVYGFWIDGTAINYKKRTSGAWDGSPTTLKSGLSSPGFLGSSSSDTVSASVIWREGTSPNYTVKFATIGFPAGGGGPDVPTGLSVTAVYQSSVTAGWNTATGATSYYLVASTNSGSPPSPINSSSDTVNTSATMFSLNPNTTYYLFVRSNGTGGPSGWDTGGVSTATLAAVPDTPVFAAVYVASITYGWDSNNDSQNTKFEAVASTTSDFNPAKATNTFSITDVSTSTTFTSLDKNTTHYFRVRAVNHNNIPTEWITTILSTSTLADVPTTLPFAGADIGVSSITFNWTSNNNPANTQFEAVVSTESSFNPTIATNTFSTVDPTTQTAFSSPALTPNTTYYFRVRAVNHNSVSTAWSSPALSTATFAAEPANRVDVTTFTNVLATQLSVNWSSGTAAGGFNPISTKYQVEYSTVSTFDATGDVVTSTQPAGAPSFDVTGLSDGGTYYFQIKAVNHNSVETAFVDFSSAVMLVRNVDIIELTYPFGGLDVGVSSISATAVNVKNDSTFPVTFSIRATTITAGSPWFISSDPDIDTNDEVALRAVFHTARPTETEFSTTTAQDLVTETYQASQTLGGGGRYTVDSSTDGVNVPAGEGRQIWFHLRLPDITSTIAPQSIEVHIRGDD